jgi:threonine aldolase
MDARAPAKIIELRSDTFTLPTAEMLQAITTAQLGNDGYGEDPTVHRLESLAARKLGVEASCLLASGTMANLASLLAHANSRPLMAVLGDQSDLFIYEDKTIATALGVIFSPVTTKKDGTLGISELRNKLEEAADRKISAVICIENPHNLCCGVVLGVDYLVDVGELARRYNAKFHLDGARLFNAAVALGVGAPEIVGAADSVQFCLSKGLSAPVGSIVGGSRNFIGRLREKRKILGGEMRQAGIIAAAGIVALEQMVEALRTDHAHARELAEGLAQLAGVELDLQRVQTNTVVFRINDSRFSTESFIEAAWSRGLRLSEFKQGRIRAVVHSGIDEADIVLALAIFRDLLTTESESPTLPTLPWNEPSSNP